MKIFPAIDLIGGKVVRLQKGNYETAKTYYNSAEEAVELFIEQGAKNLHVVDLDGAAQTGDNVKIIENIVKRYKIFVEVGGGIRNLDAVSRYLGAGAGRLILGTAAVENFDFTEEVTKKYGKAIAVGVDAIDGKVMTRGWRKEAGIDSLQFCEKLKGVGVDAVIYTDISKDGMLGGTNLKIYDVLCQTKYPKIVASGGISSADEILKLKSIGVSGVILGKALYEKKLDLREVLKLV